MSSYEVRIGNDRKAVRPPATATSTTAAKGSLLEWFVDRDDAKADGRVRFVRDLAGELVGRAAYAGGIDVRSGKTGTGAVVRGEK